MPDAIVLAIHAEHADAILDGTARFEHRSVPPKRLPARAYLVSASQVYAYTPDLCRRNVVRERFGATQGRKLSVLCPSPPRRRHAVCAKPRYQSRELRQTNVAWTPETTEV